MRLARRSSDGRRDREPDAPRRALVEGDADRPGDLLGQAAHQAEPVPFAVGLGDEAAPVIDDRQFARALRVGHLPQTDADDPRAVRKSMVVAVGDQFRGDDAENRDHVDIEDQLWTVAVQGDRVARELGIFQEEIRRAMALVLCLLNSSLDSAACLISMPLIR